jgi:hypothetical protein
MIESNEGMVTFHNRLVVRAYQESCRLDKLPEALEDTDQFENWFCAFLDDQGCGLEDHVSHTGDVLMQWALGCIDYGLLRDTMIQYLADTE